MVMMTSVMMNIMTMMLMMACDAEDYEDDSEKDDNDHKYRNDDARSEITPTISVVKTFQEMNMILTITCAGSLVAEHDEKIERQCFYIALALEI